MIIYFFRALAGFLLQTLPPAFLCIYPFWSRLSPERKRPILFFFFGGFLILGIFIAMIFMDTLRAGQPSSNVNLINLLMFFEQACCFLIYMLVIRDRFFKKLFCLTFISSFFAGLALVASFLNRLLFPDIAFGIFEQDGLLWSIPGVTFFFLLSIIAFPLLFRIVRQMSKYMFDFDRPIFWRNLCVLPVLFYLWIFLTPNDLLYGWIITSATTIMLLLELFIALFSIQNMALLISCQKKIPVIKTPTPTKTLLSQEAYCALREKLQASEVLCHDFKHQLLVLKHMLSDRDFNQARSHIDLLLAETDAVKPILLSGNYLIDTLINGHLYELASQGIQIEVHADIPDVLPYDYDELYSILHKILLLSIEGCKSVAVETSKLTLDLVFLEKDLHVTSVFPCLSNDVSLLKDLETLLANNKGTFELTKDNANTKLSILLTLPSI